MVLAPILLEEDQDTTVLLTLNLESVGLTDNQFERLCADNPELVFELSAEQELIVMSPTSIKTGRRNSRLGARLDGWAEADGTGYAFDSSTMYTLPNGAKRSPDASWIRRERVDVLDEDEQDRFAHIVPDFVVELRSKSDSLRRLRAKMEEYIANGVRLGWLIDPRTRTVYVYRPSQPAEELHDPATLSGEPVLPGFTLNVAEIW